MKITKGKLNQCFIIEPTIFEDKRGFFYESFNAHIFEKQTGQSINFIQDNHSKSSYGVLRGLHFQKGEYAQAKLVRVLSGEVLDVAVDLRKNSTTYGLHESIVLSSENKKQFFIPRGFAHGFVVLSESAEFVYKCDTPYNKKSEGGIRYNDQTLSIDWNLPEKDIIISKKDERLDLFSNSRQNFTD